jgi:hypothetical protein
MESTHTEKSTEQVYPDVPTHSPTLIDHLTYVEDVKDIKKRLIRKLKKDKAELAVKMNNRQKLYNKAIDILLENEKITPKVAFSHYKNVSESRFTTLDFTLRIWMSGHNTMFDGLREKIFPELFDVSSDSDSD